MNNKGFFLLESLVSLALGLTLILTCLASYRACLVTLQKKLLLEDAVMAADYYLAGQTSALPDGLELAETEQATSIEGLTLREVQVSHEGKLIFTLTMAK